MISKENLLSIVSQSEEKTIGFRRHLHKNPELSFCEENTMKYICSQLDEMNIEYKSGIAGTGVVAVIRGEKHNDNPKTLLIRADMDALPIYEKSEKDYISQKQGVMHACGHDGHTAILLSVCEVLKRLKSEFSGCIKFVFQPGEETSGGAKPMIDAGIMDNPKVDACLALHVDPDIDTGKVRVKPGPLYASPDNFKIIINGKGGHGAEPEKCINPINIGAEIINRLNKITETEINSGEKAIVTVCSMYSGSASNIIPTSAEIIGTARSYTNEIRAFLKSRIGEISQEICRKSGATCEYEFEELYPPLINDESLSCKIKDTLYKYNNIISCIYGGEATMTGEDFAYFSQIVPGVMLKLGCRCEEKGLTYPLHHESFDIDENCLKIGVFTFVAVALDFLN